MNLNNQINMSINKLLNFIQTKKINEIGFVNTNVAGDLKVSGKLNVSTLNNGFDMTIPNTDGESGQVLQTNGSGVLIFDNKVTSINDLTDAKKTSTSLYVGNVPLSNTSDSKNTSLLLSIVMGSKKLTINSSQ